MYIIYILNYIFWKLSVYIQLLSYNCICIIIIVLLYIYTMHIDDIK